MFSRFSRSEDSTLFSVLLLMLDSSWNQKVTWSWKACSLSMSDLTCLKPAGARNINYSCTWCNLFVGSSRGLKILAMAILLDRLSRKRVEIYTPCIVPTPCSGLFWLLLSLEHSSLPCPWVCAVFTLRPHLACPTLSCYPDVSSRSFPARILYLLLTAVSLGVPQLQPSQRMPRTASGSHLWMWIKWQLVMAIKIYPSFKSSPGKEKNRTHHSFNTTEWLSSTVQYICSFICGYWAPNPYWPWNGQVPRSSCKIT